MNVPDYVERRIVCEFGRQYAYVYLTDAEGKLIDEESFKQPFRLDRKEAATEAAEAYQNLYQHLSDTIVFAEGPDEDETARGGDGPADSM